MGQFIWRIYLSFVRRGPADRMRSHWPRVEVQERPLFNTSAFGKTIGWMSLRLTRHLKPWKDPTKYVIVSQSSVIKDNKTRPSSVTG